MKLKKLLLKIINTGKSIVNSSSSEANVEQCPEQKNTQEIIPTLVDAMTAGKDSLDLNSLDIPILTEVITDTKPSQHESRPPFNSPSEKDKPTTGGDDADQPV